MMDAILASDLYKTLIAIGVTLLPFLIAGFHMKRYGFLQGIFSLICVPMIVFGFIELIIVICKENHEILELVTVCSVGLLPYFGLQKELLSITNMDWLYNTGWIYMPYAVLFVLTYGFSITIRQKKKKSKNS